VNTLVVVENPRRWPFDLEGVEVVPARTYLTDRRYAEQRRVAVYNLCRNYGYQTVGYYVSLLAAARGHRPLPSVGTLQALGEPALVRIASAELDDLIQRSLAPLKSTEFSLSIYFGRNVAKRYDRLSRALFNQFPAPFLRARLARDEQRWRLVSLRPVAAGEVPDEHREFALAQARQYFARPTRVRPRKAYRYDLAILVNPREENPPSDEGALRRFRRAAHAAGIGTEVVGRDDYGRVGEFDALFIRETTAVNHHTYRFASRAAAEGLVVLDHPESIVRCGNKVYQAELFARHGVACPHTVVVHEGNVDDIVDAVGLPCVLKKPDGSFSQGVRKVEDEAELRRTVAELFRESELVVAQTFTPSAFDWRIGVLDRQVLYVCKYHMARGHWQIVHGSGATTRYGRVEPVAVSAAPGEAVELGLRAASLVGDGLYGVDIKEVGGRFLVMEVNDNPNLESGLEDAILKDGLYEALVRWFGRRLDARGGGAL
jgi:glutathione synthase/RimK-type ligase-like ATP-grasp enzyme